MTDEGGGSMLARVFWVGGSTCAGKSTTADRLGERFGIAVYHFDRHEPFHYYRAIPEDQPNMIRFVSRTLDERWVLQPPDAMADEAMTCWGERFPMVVEDLQRLARQGPVIAEGVGLFPDLIAPHLGAPEDAVFLIAAPGWIEHVRTTRQKTVADHPRISDRDRAFSNIVARDTLIASRVEHQASRLGLRTITVDESSVGRLEEMLEPSVAAWLSRQGA